MTGKLEKFTAQFNQEEFLITQGDPYVVMEDGKEVIAITESVFKYKNDKVYECYQNQIIIDYDPDPKEIFKLILKGRTELDYR